MARCEICHQQSASTNARLSVCLACIRRQPDQALSHIDRAHEQSRMAFGLPKQPPRAQNGLHCDLCANTCRMAQGQWGFCALRHNSGGRLEGASAQAGALSWYTDSLPTNCVGDWVCPGGTGAGYPRYAHRNGPEYGYHNLAVFMHACTMNCLFCQNWSFKKQSFAPPNTSPVQLVDHIQTHCACVCFFGGDPSAQLPFTLKAARQAQKRFQDRILRFCWETNGSMHPRGLDQMMALALASGGLVKFDLKAWSQPLHRALTGRSNQRVLANFRRAGSWFDRRSFPPLLIAATLLVPGYMDEQEVGHLARFIAGINPNIPYSLLAFHPSYQMVDLPPTSKALAENCMQVALSAGLKYVRIGNRHLLR